VVNCGGECIQSGDQNPVKGLSLSESVTDILTNPNFLTLIFNKKLSTIPSDRLSGPMWKKSYQQFIMLITVLYCTPLYTYDNI